MSTKKSDSPFAALEAMRAALPVGSPPTSASASTPAPASAKPGPKPPARAVVRLERKHRGGKTVTIVDKLELRERDLEAWCKDLKRSLGCGGAIEDGVIILQGDLRERTAALLTARGVTKVTIAN